MAVSSSRGRSAADRNHRIGGDVIGCASLERRHQSPAGGPAPAWRAVATRRAVLAAHHARLRRDRACACASGASAAAGAGAAPSAGRDPRRAAARLAAARRREAALRRRRAGAQGAGAGLRGPASRQWRPRGQARLRRLRARRVLPAPRRLPRPGRGRGAPELLHRPRPARRRGRARRHTHRPAGDRGDEARDARGGRDRARRRARAPVPSVPAQERDGLVAAWLALRRRRTGAGPGRGRLSHQPTRRPALGRRRGAQRRLRAGGAPARRGLPAAHERDQAQIRLTASKAAGLTAPELLMRRCLSFWSRGANVGPDSLAAPHEVSDAPSYRLRRAQPCRPLSPPRRGPDPHAAAERRGADPQRSPAQLSRRRQPRAGRLHELPGERLRPDRLPPQPAALSRHPRALRRERAARPGHQRPLHRGPQSVRSDRVLIGSKKPPGRTARLRLPAKPGRPAREALVAVRFMAVELARPTVGVRTGLPKSVVLNLVDVREVDPPAGEGVHWRLLTTLPVADAAEAFAVADLYRRRWAIEQLFRTLKTKGFDIEAVRIGEDAPGASSPWRRSSPPSPSSSSSTPATAAPLKAASGPSPTPSALTTCPSSKPCAKASKARPNDNATPTPGARSPMRHGSAPASADGPATTASPDPSSCSRAGSSSPNAAPPSWPRNAMCESASPSGRGGLPPRSAQRQCGNLWFF